MIDSLSFELTGKANWPVFAKKLQSLITSDGEVDHAEAGMYLSTKAANNTCVAHFNYVMGTNGQDMGHPNPAILVNIDKDLYVQQSPICEGRFVQALLPWSDKSNGSVQSNVDPIDHNKVIEFFKRYESSHKKKFVFNLYASENDTVAGPEAYEDERNLFGSWLQYQYLPDTGHDAWFADPSIANNLLKL